MDENGLTNNGTEFIERADYEATFFQYICCVGNVDELVETLQTMQFRDVLYKYDNYGRQPLHAVAECDVANAKSKIELLFEMGADINATELVMGNTLLHIAVATRNYLLAEWLCRQPGVNLGSINFMHETAYHIAYRARDLRMMELLRTNGAVCDDPPEEDDASETLNLPLR